MIPQGHSIELSEAACDHAVFRWRRQNCQALAVFRRRPRLHRPSTYASSTGDVGADAVPSSARPRRHRRSRPFRIGARTCDRCTETQHPRAVTGKNAEEAYCSLLDSGATRGWRRGVEPVLVRIETDAPHSPLPDHQFGFRFGPDDSFSLKSTCSATASAMRRRLSGSASRSRLSKENCGCGCATRTRSARLARDRVHASPGRRTRPARRRRTRHPDRLSGGVRRLRAASRQSA